MLIRSGLLGAAIIALTLSPSLAGHHVAEDMKVAETASGKVLTNIKGMSLYVFDKDKAGQSNCNGDCAKKWPPMPAESSSKGKDDFTVVKRADGTYQWAHKGKPLYTWFKDTKAGDITGDGILGVWHLARP